MTIINYSYIPMPPRVNVRHVFTFITDLGTAIEQQYQIHPQHRNRSPQKAQWTVSYEDELVVFAWAICEEGVTGEQYIWGLLIEDGESCIIGKTKYGDATKIAIFDNGDHNDFWHGYPADYIRSQEYPSDDILGRWRDKGYITKADIRRIIRGKW